MDTEQQGRAVWREEKPGNGRRRGKGGIFVMFTGCRVAHSAACMQRAGSSSYKQISPPLSLLQKFQMITIIIHNGFNTAWTMTPFNTFH